MTMNRDNSGNISKNKTKEKDNHPDIKGQCTIDGRDYWISGWQKSNDRGSYYSLSFKAKDDQPQRQQPATRGAGPSPIDEDMIPFRAEWR